MALTVDRHLTARRISCDPIADITKPLTRGAEPCRPSASRATHLDGQAIGKKIDGNLRTVVTFIDVSPDNLRICIGEMIFVLRIGRGRLAGAACRAQYSKGCDHQRSP